MSLLKVLRDMVMSALFHAKGWSPRDLAWDGVLLIEGDPIANIKLLEDPGKNLVVIMKEGRSIRNIGGVGSTSQKANRNISPLLLYGD